MFFIILIKILVRFPGFEKLMRALLVAREIYCG